MIFFPRLGENFFPWNLYVYLFRNNGIFSFFFVADKVFLLVGCVGKILTSSFPNIYSSKKNYRINTQGRAFVFFLHKKDIFA